jgi:hypothetical protein
MIDESLSRIARLGASGEPQAGLLNPEVRSGASFSFGTPSPGPAVWPNFKVVWFYTVDVDKREDFATKLGQYESGASPTGALTYLGTYSVSISNAAPDLEYRTIWGLDSLAAIQDLNVLLHSPPQLLQHWFELINKVPVVRSEIMGRTVFST